MQNSMTAGLRKASGFIRIVAAAVVVAHSMLVTMPAAAAVRADAVRTEPAKEGRGTEERQLNETVRELEGELARLRQKVAEGQDFTGEKGVLKRLRKEVERLNRVVSRNFEAIEEQLRKKNVPRLILERHEQTVESYHAEVEALLDHLERIERSDDPETVGHEALGAARQLKGKKHERAHQPFDPEHLPHHAPHRDERREPRTEKEDYRKSGLFDTPYPKFAALGEFTFDSLADASDPAYLAETAEITLTEAVRSKAAELSHDPVAIYHWVRNNVEWAPNWGAMQDADVTLGSRRGNAMDIAGLTIALLRASGVPARYTHGTIAVEESRFRNWVGGFTHIADAARYAASGGIPITTIYEAGRIAKVRLEHVWVEAAVDYFPSRGAVMRSADAWVALDAAFKQYEFLDGIDVMGVAGLDPVALADSFVQSGTVSETEGWVQGLNASVLEEAQLHAQQALESYVSAMTDPTVGEVIGGRKVIVQEFPSLPSALPNAVVVTGARYGDLPDALRHRLQLAMATDIFGELSSPVTLPYARINNHRFTLSFRPETAADEEALLSLLPEGEITDVSQLPQSIPSYLISVVPELKLEGEVVLAGNPMRLGEDLPFAFQLLYPQGSSTIYRSPVVAGSYLALATVGGSVSAQKLTELKARVGSTQAKLESQDRAQIASLTREDLLGDMFYAGVLAYFAEYNVLGNLTGLAQHGHVQLLPSAGTYGYAPEVQYLFGFPRSIVPGGVEMDLDAVANALSVDGKGHEAWKRFNFQLGALSSALEHAVPEQMFVTPENPGEAVSAVKALQKAAQQGQRIYHITRANLATALPNLNLSSSTQEEIRRAVQAGREVITHTDPISVPGWKGAGYVIFDPEVGNGAWKIGGGMNGGKKALEAAKDLLVNAISGVVSALSEHVGQIMDLIDKLHTLLDLLDKCKSLIVKVMVFFSVMLVLSYAVAWFFSTFSVQGKVATAAMAAMFGGLISGNMIAKFQSQPGCD